MANHWQHIRPQSIGWQAVGEGLQRKDLADTPAVLRQWQVPARGELELQGLLLVTDGEATCGDQTLLPRTLFWSATAVTVGAGDEGTCLYQLIPSRGESPNVSQVVLPRDELPWEEFDDPAGRPTQPVQVLLEGSLAALRTRFVPEYSAGEHWHDFDTFYFITNGDMQFGDEGQYYTGDVRQVQGGYSYGPEQPGPDGVEFVLVSLGGGVALHWADLEPAPNGRLQP